MTDSEGGAMAFGFLAGFAVVVASQLVLSCGEEHKRRAFRSNQACRPATVLSADNGVAACSDGRVYRWREGYLTPVGRSR